jgi:glycosyltransferase involved in cell wall biosynthesis
MGSNGSVEVSVLVPVLNEAAVIRASADAMLGQRLDRDFELLFVDGGSDDGSRAILDELAAADPRIRVLDNPARAIPNALNVGLRAARGRYVARMDAHTFYPPDYLAAGVRRLEQGGVEWVAGPALPRGEDDWSRRVELALRSRLGVGGASFRLLAAGEAETDTGFTGVWRRETLERHDGWDERWPVNEDAELAARVRKAGGRIVCVPEMAAGYVPRRSLKALGRQYWRYGQYRAKTSGRHPESTRRSHFIPPALVVTLAGALLPGRLARPARAGVALYAAALAAESVRLGREHGRGADALYLPAVFATMHVTWGAGFLVGSARFGPPLEALRRSIRPPGRG